MINVNTHLKSYFENSSKTPQSSFKILVLFSCCLVVLCLITFYQALTFDFLDFDDTDYIVNNPVVRSGLSWSGLQWAFTSLHVGNWHPLTSIFMMGEVSLFGVNATGFHAINLLLHTINAILLFLILTQATQSLSPSFFAACIFAIHPTRTESVVWIVELKDVLSTFFILWAILLYIKNNKRFGIPIFILYVLSLMSKQMYVTLPALLLVLDYWPLKRFSREKIMGLIFEKIPYAFASISAALIVLSAHSSGGSLASQDAYPLTLRLQNVITSTIQYFENFFLLFKSSSFLDPYRETYPLSLWLPCLLFFLTMTTLVCVFRKRHPYLLSGWLFFTISLLPIIGIIQTGSQALADRFTYFSYVGLAIMFFYFSYAYLSKSKQGRFLFITGGLIISILAAVACAIQVSHWKNVTTLFQHAISVNPKNYFAQFKLGQIFYYDKADPEKAKFHLLQAIALKPSIPAAHDILGQIQSNDGDYKNAEKFFKIVLKLFCDNARVVELVDTQDLKSCDLNSRTSSILVPGTK